MDFRLHIRNVTPSTNDLVKEALRVGCEEGEAFVALEQSAGYGRQGRSWKSPVGGLYLSVGLRPPVEIRHLGSLSLVVALGVREALLDWIAPRSSVGLRVKWPNDIVYVLEWSSRDVLKEAASQSRPPRQQLRLFGKVVGISLERSEVGLCVGIGVNVYKPSYPLDVGGKNLPVYLVDLGFPHHGAYRFLRPESPSRLSPSIVVADGSVQGERQRHLVELACAILTRVGKIYERWCAEGFLPFQHDYDEVNVLTGRDVSLETVDGMVTAEGFVLGVDSEGSLRLEGGDGGVMSYGSGEAHILDNEAL